MQRDSAVMTMLAYQEWIAEHAGPYWPGCATSCCAAAAPDAVCAAAIRQLRCGRSFPVRALSHSHYDAVAAEHDATSSSDVAVAVHPRNMV